MSRAVSLLEKLYPCRNLPTTIYQKRTVEHKEQALVVAQSVVENLSEDAIYELIKSGQEWAMHQFPILEYAWNVKNDFIENVISHLEILIAAKFGEGFVVKELSRYHDCKTYLLVIDWSDFLGIDCVYGMPEGSVVYWKMVEDHMIACKSNIFTENDFHLKFPKTYVPSDDDDQYQRWQSS